MLSAILPIAVVSVEALHTLCSGRTFSFSKLPSDRRLHTSCLWLMMDSPRSTHSPELLTEPRSKTEIETNIQQGPGGEPYPRHLSQALSKSSFRSALPYATSAWNAPQCTYVLLIFAFPPKQIRCTVEISLPRTLSENTTFMDKTHPVSIGMYR